MQPVLKVRRPFIKKIQPPFLFATLKLDPAIHASHGYSLDTAGAFILSSANRLSLLLQPSAVLRITIDSGFFSIRPIPSQPPPLVIPARPIMSDFDHFGSSDEENAEIKKLQAEVVRDCDIASVAPAVSTNGPFANICCACRTPIPITSSTGRSLYAPARVWRAA